MRTRCARQRACGAVDRVRAGDPRAQPSPQLASAVETALDALAVGPADEPSPHVAGHPQRTVAVVLVNLERHRAPAAVPRLAGGAGLPAGADRGHRRRQWLDRRVARTARRGVPVGTVSSRRARTRASLPRSQLASRRPTAECVAFINNDMRVDPRWLTELVAAYDPDGEHGVRRRPDSELGRRTRRLRRRRHELLRHGTTRWGSAARSGSVATRATASRCCSRAAVRCW